MPAAKKVLRRDAGKLAVYSNEGGQAVRRLLLTKTSYHLYYLIDEKRRVVRVAVIWGAARGSGPPL